MTGRPAVLDAEARVRAGLAPVSAWLAESGMPASSWRGKLIRPVVGYAAVAGGGDADEGGASASLWYALGAVQLAHEASLLHDDVIDGAGVRRGEATAVATEGVASALVEGDHLLTSAYRLAARTGHVWWMERFAAAVERTVAGEKAQGRSAGRALTWEEYEAVVLGKSGELLGAALSVAPALRGEGEVEVDRYYALGRRVGLVYQMLDDLLDYCPAVDTGKPALADGRRGLWTWPLAHVPATAEAEPALAARLLREPDEDGIRPVDHCVDRLRSVAAEVAAEAAVLLPGDGIIPALLDEWVAAAESAAGPSPRRVVLPPVAGWEQLMTEHARSFRLAARLFPSDRRAQVVGVYAWCRYTDELVDGAALPPAELEARLDAWLDLSRRAYQGERTGNELADRVMGEMRVADVPFAYAAELIEGMRMDVHRVEYGTLSELRMYTYRVASVVGLWLTELFGVRDPWMLDRAAALGHAMQLTNILRDVGEDLGRGRLYLPTAWLSAHGLSRADLERMLEAGAPDAAYGELIERLLRVAEEEYALAEPAIDRLPGFYRRPVRVASALYRGIHLQIRRNGYDNLTRRAHTSLTDKVWLGLRAFGSGRVQAPEVGRLGRAVALTAALVLGASPLAAQAPPDLRTPGDITRAVSVPGVMFREVRDRVGVLWLRAVEDPAAVAEGLDAVATLRGQLLPGSATRASLLLDAYEGAFLTLRAKHGGWPGARLRNLREGFERMDAAVWRAPDAAELRYVRLMSGFYLPGFFRRGDVVDEDLLALARLLPDSRDAFPAELLPEVRDFVLKHAALDAPTRARLEVLRP
jgi:15-cis-phytoene synthase